MNSFIRSFCILSSLAIAGLLVFTAPAAAYLDPGTGSMLLQAIIASMAASVSFIWMIREKIRAFFFRRSDDTNHKSKPGRET
jgi:hypothetical protein